MDKSKLVSYSLMSAFGVFVYVFLVVWLLNSAASVLDGSPDYLNPIAFLLLFVVSATITGLLVLGRPVHMYLAGMKDEAVRLLVYTIIWLIVIVVIVFAILAST